MTHPIEHQEAVERVQYLLDSGGPKDAAQWPDIAADLRTLLADRDKLEAENEVLRSATVGPLSYTAMRAAKESAQASNASLVGALRPFAAIYAERMKDFPDGSIRSIPDPDTPAWGYNGCDLNWGHFQDAYEGAQALSTLDSGEAAADNNPETAIPDFLKRQTGELPPLVFPERRDDDGREGRREGAEEGPSDNNRKGAATAWRPASEAPSVPHGEDRYHIVAVRRHHSGKVYSFPATYLNQKPLIFDEDAEMEERPTSGWFSLESEGDEGDKYFPVLHGADELLAWCDVPQFRGPDALSPSRSPVGGQPSASDICRVLGEPGQSFIGSASSALAAPPSPSKADVGALVAACKPFVNWAEDNTAADGSGGGMWAGNQCERERIKDWFGPSEFYSLRAALASFTASHDGGL